MKMYFGDERSDKGLEKIKWARDNNIPIVYSYIGIEWDGQKRHEIKHTKNSRWMTTQYKLGYDITGQASWRGGHLIIRDRDAALWILRWGKVGIDDD